MQELIKAIEQEKQLFEKRKSYYLNIQDRYRCVERTARVSYIAIDLKETLHELYDAEKRVEKLADELFTEYKDDKYKLMQLIIIFGERIKGVIKYLQEEGRSWKKICNNIQRELKNDIAQYESELRFLKIREISIGSDKGELAEAR